MNSIPDTSLYMFAGYGVIFGVILVYLASIVVRFRNLRQDEKTLDELEKKQ